MKEKEKSPNWGGKRAGAGRKRNLPQMLVQKERKNRSFYISEGENLFLRDMLQLYRRGRNYTAFEQESSFATVIDTMVKIQLDLPINNQVNEDNKEQTSTNQVELFTPNQDVVTPTMTPQEEDIPEYKPQPPTPTPQEDDDDDYAVMAPWDNIAPWDK